MGRKAQKNDSLPGSLDMLILRTLCRRDLHGYGIVQFIQQSSDNELLVEEGGKARVFRIGSRGRRGLGRDRSKLWNGDDRRGNEQPIQFPHVKSPLGFLRRDPNERYAYCNRLSAAARRKVEPPLPRESPSRSRPRLPV